MTPCYLYKYVLNNEIIYIGKTKRDLNLRINEHKTKKDLPDNCDIYYYECANEAEMNVKEILLINAYHPKYNKDCKTEEFFDNFISFNEPFWLPYKYYSTGEFLRYEKDPKTFKTVAVFRKGKKETKRKPSYCECDMDMPVKEYHDNCSFYRCSFCGSVIKNSFEFENKSSCQTQEH